MRALVLDGDTRAALAIVRSLGSHGIHVTVASDDEASLAGRSRYCSQTMVYPCPRATPQLFRDWLVSHMASNADTVLYTASDVTTSVAGESRSSLPSVARALLPPQESLEIALDKSATLGLARDLGVPIPKSVEFSANDSFEPDRVTFGYPVAVKAAQSDSPYRFSTAYAHDAGELGVILGEVLKESESALVQEVIPGEGTAIFALFDSGRPLVTFAHRRLREKPPWGGVGVLSQSIDRPPDTLRYALRLLTELRWNGVAMVEFKRTTSGVPCLMEINPRFWGSLQLAVISGVDFPHLAYRFATGETVVSPESHRAYNRWVLGEFDSLATAVISGVPGSSRLAQVCGHFWSLRHGPCCEVERWSDPGPALYEYNCWLRTSASRVSARLKGDTSRCGKLSAPGG